MTDNAIGHKGPFHGSGSSGWMSKATPLVAILVLAGGAVYAAAALVTDVEAAPPAGLLIYSLLGLALLIALGFEFVNGFHDTANAVATVIYTNSMPPHAAVIWSGFFNFLGVLLSSVAVAFGIISLLPVELILQVGSNAGFAMVFALLIAAIIWNLGTWYFGIPNSSSHALIGSIIGVGLMNQLMAANGSGTSGVDWDQALGVRAPRPRSWRWVCLPPPTATACRSAPPTCCPPASRAPWQPMARACRRPRSRT